MTRERLQNVTQQWVDEKVYDAMMKCIEFRPELDVNVKAIEKDESKSMVKVKIYVNNVGKYLFVQKLTYFLCTALMDYSEKD